MAEELTTKMHSEFSVNNDIDVKHRCLCALQDLQDGYTMPQLTKLYNVTEAQINEAKNEFDLLLGK